MGYYLSQETVEEAVQKLKDTGLGRTQASLWRWLLLKSQGLGPNTTATFTSERCTEFADRWVRVHGLGDERTIFQPFDGAWAWAEGKTAWSVQTLYTQLNRQVTKREREIWHAAEDTGTPGLWSISGADPSSYAQGLKALFKKRVPLVPLAVWRYRTDELPEDTDEQTLAQRLVDELELTAAELNAVFSDDRPEVTPADEADDEGASDEAEGA